MLGLGLSGYVPYVVYAMSFFVAFLSVFYRREIGILFIVPLFPAYSALDKALKLDLPLANNAVDMVIVGMLLGWAMQGGREQEKGAERSPLIVPIMIFAGYTLFSLLIGSFSFDMDINMQRLAHWKNYMIVPILYLITFYGLKERKWKYILLILMAITMLAAEFKFKQTLRWYNTSHFSDQSRLTGTFGFLGPNEWGSFQAMTALFGIGLFLVDKHLRRRLLYIPLIAGGIYSVMYSYSRGAYMGFALSLFIIALVRSRKMLIPIVACFLLWKSILPLPVVERIQMTFLEEGAMETEVIQIGEAHVFTAGRGHLWEKAVDQFLQNPLFGSGYNTYQRLIGWDTHSLYLKTIAEQGIIGIMILLWLFYLALRSGWRLYRASEETFIKALGFGFFCAALGSALVNFFGDRWTYLQIGGIFWVLWAIVDQEYSRIAPEKERAQGSGDSIEGKGSEIQEVKGPSELAQNI